MLYIVNNELHICSVYFKLTVYGRAFQESVDRSTLPLRIATGTATASAARSAAKISSAKDFLPTAATSCVQPVAKLK